MKIKKVKNKKSLIAIVAVLLIAVVGVTFAYFQSQGVFRNVFQSGTFRLVTREVFESPDNWRPGEEIPKTITTTNEGTIPAAVRMTYTEKWLDKDGNDITASIQSGSVIINLDNENDWKYKDDGYYYYKYFLDPQETTSSFIKSVTLSEGLDSVSCTMNGSTEVCESSNPALGGAKYYLTIIRDTVQYDRYKEAWNTNIGIHDKSQKVILLQGSGDDIQPGDVVGIGDTEDFYVLSSDNSENGKTVLFAKYGLLVTNVPESHAAGEGLQDEFVGTYTGGSSFAGHVEFSNSYYWMDGNDIVRNYDPNNIMYLDDSPGSYNSIRISEWRIRYKDDNKIAAPYVYDENSNIYQYVNDYVNRLKAIGAPSTITGRLMSYEEAVEYQNVQSGTTPIIITGEQSYWLGSACNHNSVYYVSKPYNGLYTIGHSQITSGSAIRPIIEIPTSEIG